MFFKLKNMSCSSGKIIYFSRAAQYLKGTLKIILIRDSYLYQLSEKVMTKHVVSHKSLKTELIREILDL